MNNQQVLHNLTYFYPKWWQYVISFLFLFLLSLIVILAVFVKTHPEVFQWMILLIYILYILLLLPTLYTILAHHRERLFLTSSGLRYQSPLPRFLHWLKPNWSIKISEIKQVYFKPETFLFRRSGPLSMVLIIETSSLTKKIVPCIWIDPNESKERPSIMQWITLNPLQTKHVLPHCPVIKYFSSMDIDFKIKELEFKGAAQNFALETNKHSLAAVILFFTLVAYILLDAFLNQETYVALPFYKVYFWGGVNMAVLIVAWLVAAKVPIRKSFAVALLVGGVFGAALYPGLLRINQLTDIEGLQTYQYVLQKDYSLKALNNPSLPPLSFEQDLDYWSHFDWNSIHKIELRKGALGFYQINMAPIYADMRQYFRQHH
ncbi:hypothetical protein PN36_05315 [Candidatus Thiomargarita nelsonii]|uniref:Uncharacterized protein n=1 Tax=Candidatus Thiomargarita nelsonii TaxID=1003181 RepID=A0A0A6P248_9GAMM|nr:hypothetical protein PN36_05315 [Candidatus Thiomargarita nelsonii]